MAFTKVLGISCLFSAIASASPIAQQAPGATEVVVEGDITIENPTIFTGETINAYGADGDDVTTEIIEIIYTTTVYEPYPGPTGTGKPHDKPHGSGKPHGTGHSSGHHPQPTVNPGGPVSPLYPITNTTTIVIGPTGTGTAPVWLSTGTAPAPWLSTGTAPVWLSTGTAPGPIGTGAASTGWSTGVIPSPSGGAIPLYPNSTYVSPTIAPSGTAPAGTAPLGTAPPGTAPLGTGVFTSAPLSITPTPTPIPESEVIEQAIENLGEFVESWLVEWFPFITQLPGFEAGIAEASASVESILAPLTVAGGPLAAPTA